MKRSILLLLTAIVFSCTNRNQESKAVNDVGVMSNTFIDKVEPPYWWVGMKEKSLQLLAYEENIGDYSVEISYPGVSVEKVHKAKSSNYLFIDLNVSEETQSGKFDIVFKNDQDEKRHTYELKSRAKLPEMYVGFDSSDAIFLITPDRFSNGDSSNDIDESLNEKQIDRSDDYARHGGDIRGIINHLDYIHDLGYTSVWSTPLLINDMYRGCLLYTSDAADD